MGLGERLMANEPQDVNINCTVELLEDKMGAAVDPNHYKGMKTETIAIIEDFIQQDSKLTPAQRYHCSQALKYIFRAGRKGDVNTDIRKAENYLHRALTGEWINPSFFHREVK